MSINIRLNPDEVGVIAETSKTLDAAVKMLSSYAKAFANVAPAPGYDYEQIEDDRHAALLPVYDAGRRMNQLFDLLDQKMKPLDLVETRPGALGV